MSHEASDDFTALNAALRERGLYDRVEVTTSDETGIVDIHWEGRMASGSLKEVVTAIEMSSDGPTLMQSCRELGLLRDEHK